MELTHDLAGHAARANAAHLAASGAAVSALEHARTAGEHLAAAKEQVQHGKWLAWLAENFDGSRDTASNYMRIAMGWERLNVEHVPHLTVRAALASLAEPKATSPKPETPADRVAAAVERSAEIIKRELAQNDGWLDDGTGEMVHVPSLPEREQDRVIGNAVVEETYERRMRQGEHIQAHFENHDAQGKVIDPAKPYFDFIARQACIKCDAQPVEVAHVRTIISPKTGLLMPRSHKGLARFGVVPLCPDCHRHAAESIHNVGEESFNEALGRGQHFLFQKAASLMAEFMNGGQ